MLARFWVYLAAALVSLTTIAGALASDAGGSLRCDAQEAWQRVRATYPIHAQIMAKCVSPDGAQHVIVLTEPPPHLTRSKADAIVQALLGMRVKVERRRHVLGYNGWVEDLVIVANVATVPGGVTLLDDGLTRLAIYAFGSAYKAEVEDIASMALASHWEAPAPLDVSDGDLYAWMLGPNAFGLVAAADISPANLKAISDGGGYGVYYTVEPGLVVALLPARADKPLNDYAATLRRFAVDSDALIGAVKLGDRVALVGRERTASLRAQPPLRVESILLLASQRSAQLKQSYERNRPFAGKLLTGAGELFGWDWAPILLSNELIDTEFGSVLNFTDNMLKSWSEGGKVEYKGWTHPRPERFPFGEPGAAKSLGTDELTFNWNTAGVGHVSQSNGLEIFSLRSTGSLPVSYFPEGSQHDAVAKSKLVAAEDRAYEYFRSRRSPMLERAVQYAALYQVFQAFDVHAAPPHGTAPANAGIGGVERVLQQQVRNALAVLSRADTPSTDDIRLATIYAKYGNAGNPGLRLADADAVPRLRREIAREISALDAAKTPAWRELYIKGLAIDDRPRLVTREELVRINEEQRQLAEIEGHVRKVVREGWGLAIPLEQVRKAVVATTEHDPEGWIRTPSIVVSRYETRQVIGGHNIGGHPTRVEIDAGVKRGTPNISGNYSNGRVIRINPGDAPASRDLVRIFDREMGLRDSPEVVARAVSALEARLREPITARAPRMDMSALLERPRSADLPFRGAPPTPQSRQVGFGPRRASPAQRKKLDALSDGSDADFVVTRPEPATYLIADVRKPEVAAVSAPNIPSIANFFESRVASGRSIKIVTDVSDLGRSLETALNVEVAAGGAGGKPPFGAAKTAAAAGDSPRRPAFSVEYKLSENKPGQPAEPGAAAKAPRKGSPSVAANDVPPVRDAPATRNDGPPTKSEPALPKKDAPSAQKGDRGSGGGDPPSGKGGGDPPEGRGPTENPDLRVSLLERRPGRELQFESAVDRELLQKATISDWQKADVKVRVRAPGEADFPFAREMDGGFVHQVDVSVPAKIDGKFKTVLVNALGRFKSALSPALAQRLDNGVQRIFKGSADPDLKRALQRYKEMLLDAGADKFKARVRSEKDIIVSDQAKRAWRSGGG